VSHTATSNLCSTDVSVSPEGVRTAAAFVAEQFAAGKYSAASWKEQPLNPQVADENAIQWFGFSLNAAH
jgi:hypothetical protein